MVNLRNIPHGLQGIRERENNGMSKHTAVNSQKKHYIILVPMDMDVVGFICTSKNKRGWFLVMDLSCAFGQYKKITEVVFSYAHIWKHERMSQVILL